MANPQSWNRYSYVTNNPLRYTDATGHSIDQGCGTNDPNCDDLPAPTPEPDLDKEDKDDDDKRGDASNATIRIGFGDFGYDGIPVGGSGLGTVIHNGDGYSTIITAWHVYAPGGYFFYRTGDDAELHILSMRDVQTFPLYAKDIMLVQLPIELPDEFVPAELGHYAFTGGENVTVAYQDENRGLHVLETNVRMNDTHIEGLFIGSSAVTVENLGGILGPGDSGGGVFYNGQLVGVSSRAPGSFMSFEQP